MALLWANLASHGSQKGKSLLSPGQKNGFLALAGGLVIIDVTMSIVSITVGFGVVGPPAP